jgi:hypothetical protein
MMEIRPLAACDRLEWERLYRGYADFYRVETSTHKLATSFDWLMDPAHPCKDLVAVAEDGGLTCLADYRAMPLPLRGVEGEFLDDLFVDPYPHRDGTGGRFSGASTKSLQHAAGAWFGGSRAKTITGHGAYMTDCLTDPTGLPKK